MDSKSKVLVRIASLLFKAFLFSIIFTCSVYSQKSEELFLHGSFGIVAVCKDGIILGADSRSSIYLNDKDTTPLGYYDGNQKIYILKNFAMLITGLGSVNRKTLIYYVNKFDSTLDHNIPLESIAVQWYRFILSDSKLTKEFQKCGVVMARWENDTAKICIPYPNFKGILTSEGEAFYATDTLAFKNEYQFNYSFTEMKKVIKKSINDYAFRTGQTKTIGGEIYFITISKGNKIEWYNRKPRKQFFTISEFWESYKSHEIKVTFTSDEDRKAVEDWFNN